MLNFACVVLSLDLLYFNLSTQGIFKIVLEIVQNRHHNTLYFAGCF
jgi:hypothetical protein